MTQTFTPSAPQRTRTPRMTDWLVIALLLAVLVWLIAPQQLPVSLYKLSLVALAAVAGYWIDRSLFPYARPDAFLQLGNVHEPMVRMGGDAYSDEVPWINLDVAPDTALLQLAGQAMLRRAIIVAATMLAVGLGA